MQMFLELLWEIDIIAADKSSPALTVMTWGVNEAAGPECLELFLLTEPGGLPRRFPEPAEAESDGGGAAGGNAPPEWPTGTAAPP